MHLTTLGLLMQILEVTANAIVKCLLLGQVFQKGIHLYIRFFFYIHLLQNVLCLHFVSAESQLIS